MPNEGVCTGWQLSDNVSIEERGEYVALKHRRPLLGFDMMQQVEFCSGRIRERNVIVVVVVDVFVVFDALHRVQIGLGHVDYGHAEIGAQRVRHKVAEEGVDGQHVALLDVVQHFVVVRSHSLLLRFSLEKSACRLCCLKFARLKRQKTNEFKFFYVLVYSNMIIKYSNIMYIKNC